MQELLDSFHTIRGNKECSYVHVIYLHLVDSVVMDERRYTKVIEITKTQLHGYELLVKSYVSHCILTKLAITLGP